MSINHFIITGNVTRPLELRHTPKGTPTVTYTVACNDIWYDEGGVKHEDCDYVPVTTFGKQAERDAKYLGQGSPVAVEGRIQSWYQATEKRGGFNFKALRVQYLGKGAPRAETARQSSAEVDAWMRDYERAEGAQGAALQARLPAKVSTRS